MPVLDRLLSSSDSRSQTLRALDHLLVLGIDISPTFPRLDQLMVEDTGNAGMNAAAIRTSYFLNKRPSGIPQVEEFLAADSPQHVRTGALYSLARAINQKGQNQKKLISLAAAQLLHPDQAHRKQAWEILEKALRVGIDINPGEKMVKKLVDRISFDEKLIQELYDLAASEDPDIQSEIFGLIRNTENLDKGPFFALFQKGLFSASANVRVRSLCELGEAIKNRREPDSNLELLIERFQNSEEKVQEDVLATLSGLTEFVSPPQILPLILPKISLPGMVGYYCTKILKGLAGRIQVREAYPVLLNAVSDPEFHRRKDFATILTTSILSGIRSGNPGEIPWTAFGKLLFDEKNEMKNPIADTFKTMIDEDFDISPALSDIMKCLLPPRVSYIESYFAKPVAGFLVKRNDWKNIRLLLNASGDVAGMVADVLNTRSKSGGDIAPILPDLVKHLNHKTSYVRDHFAAALLAFATQGQPQKTLVPAQLSAGDARPPREGNPSAKNRTNRHPEQMNVAPL